MKKVASHFIKLFSSLVLVAVLVMGMAGSVAAGVSSTLSYQGRLTDPTTGGPLNGTYFICFSIWDSPTGGAQLWPLVAITPTSVTTSNGVFSTQIGSVTNPLAGFDFAANSAVYLNVGVSTTNSCATPENLTPRQPIDATAYARVAENVYGGTVQVGTGAGVTSGQKFLKLDVKNTSSAEDNVGTICGSGTYLNGFLWYNSASGTPRVCANNVIKSLVGFSNQYLDFSGPTLVGGVKTFTFPDASASVLTTANLVTVAQGGTGTSTLIANNVILGNGTNAPLFVAPGAAGNVLTSDGITWVSSPAAGGGSAGGADTQIQFNNAGAFGGSANFTWNNTTNDLSLGGVDTGVTLKGITNEPTAPAAGSLHFYAKSIAGRMFPKFVGPSGLDSNIQPHIAFDKIGWWTPPGNATTVPGIVGFTAPTVLGTATARNVATTNMFTRARRLGYVSAATANNYAGHYVSVGQYTVGDGAGLGGFFYVTRFGNSDAAVVSTARLFVGMSAYTNPANGTGVEPSVYTNSIGVGAGTADTNLKIFYGGTTAQTPINLGVNFPKNTTNTDMYELTLYAPTNANNTVGYRVVRLNTGHTAEGILTAATPGTQLPSSTTLLRHRAWRNNGATATAVGIDIASVYVSTDQ